MQYVGVIVSIGTLTLAVLCAIAGGVAYAIRQEGRINALSQKIDNNKELHEREIANVAEKLTTAISALSKFDESTQTQVEAYRTHTENKIDELGRNMSAKFEKVFDKLDQKQDKQ